MVLNKKGSVLLSALIASTILTGTAYSIVRMFSGAYAFNSQSQSKTKASAYATELAEYLQAKSTAEVSQKWGSFPIGAWVNDTLGLLSPTCTAGSALSSTPPLDISTALPQNAMPGSEKFERAFSMSVLDLSTNTPVNLPCGKMVNDAIQLLQASKSNRLIYNIVVSWKLPKGNWQRATVSVLASDTINVATSPLATTPNPITVLQSTPSNPSAKSGSSFALTLHFQGGPAVDAEWLLIHFVDQNGNMVFQGDFIPSPGTDWWTGNEDFTRNIAVPPSTPPGVYRIMVGLYNLATWQRLSLIAGNGVIEDSQTRYQVGTMTVLPSVPIVKDVVMNGAAFTSALRLREAGYSVKIVAKSFSPHTTSDIAGAVWYPHKALPIDKVREWGVFTLRELILQAKAQVPGVRLTPGIKYFHRPMGLPWWRFEAAHFQKLIVKDLPRGIAAGYEYILPTLDMPVYLAFLTERAKDAGIEFEQADIRSFEELKPQASLIVNATGLGARELCRDPEVFAIRGQVVLLEKMQKARVLMDSDNPNGMIYVIPREKETVLGGTADDGDEDLAIDEKTAEAIWNRSVASFPELQNLKRLGNRVGLRPGRKTVRLELELQPKATPVIHNYGHGGSGVTLSWGCAQAVVEIANYSSRHSSDSNPDQKPSSPSR